MRLDKAVTYSGLTRKDAKKALSAGRVRVNGQTETDPGKPVAVTDSVTLDGIALRLKEHTHLMINKPAGVITATEDAHGQRTVLDCVPGQYRLKGLGPVGRLDKDVTGLVILTTDGQLAHRLISPKRGVTKQYTALAQGRLGQEDVLRFKQGMDLGDFVSAPAGLEILEAGEESSLCRVYIQEGKFHQVKRMLEKTGHPVITLSRQRIAGVTLDEGLLPGQVRELTAEEEASLYEAAGMAETE